MNRRKQSKISSFLSPTKPSDENKAQVNVCSPFQENKDVQTVLCDISPMKNILNNSVEASRSRRPVRKKNWICLREEDLIANSKTSTPRKTRQKKLPVQKNKLDTWCVNAKKKSNTDIETHITSNVQTKDLLSKLKTTLEKYDKINEDISKNLKSEFCLDDSSSSIDLSQEYTLNCKHLSDEEITQHFLNNLNFIKDISNKRKLTDTQLRVNNNHNNGLDFPSALFAFTEHQANLLLELLQKHFAAKNYPIEYFFKVLLPELYLKMFMDVHAMTKEEVRSYYLKL